MSRPVPLLFLQFILGRAMATVRRRHPGLLDRLSESGNPIYLIDPVDLPFNFVLQPLARERSLFAVRSSVVVDATATIRGSLATLIRLLEGRIDGDALFFSREISVEGSTEAVVALRNAIDGEGIDLAGELLGAAGPLAPLARKLVAIGVLAAEDIQTIRRAIVEPLSRRLDDHAIQLNKAINATDKEHLRETAKERIAS